MILNMFRASLCSSSGQLYIYSIWYGHTLYAAIQCTDQERTESDLVGGGEVLLSMMQESIDMDTD
jgi:hypothetical protein